MRRFASFVNCFLQNWQIDTFKHKTDKYSVHFQEIPGFKGKRKRGLTLTLYKNPFRYRLPVSPPRKRTKTRSSTPNSKSVSVLYNMCKYIRIINMKVCPPGWSTFYLSLNVLICVILVLSLYLCKIGYEK